MYVEASLRGAWYAFQAKRIASAKTHGPEEEQIGTLGYCWSVWQNEKDKG